MAGKWTAVMVVLIAVVAYFAVFREDKHIRVITDTQLKSTYDFIVVGAGSSGSVVASRLSEDPEVSVLLLEAGQDESGNPMQFIPASAASQWKTSLDWNYTTTPQEHACKGFKNSQCPWPRGKMLGGCSGMNGMVYARGTKLDYDGWAELGASGWSYEDVLPYFLKSEDMEESELLHSGHHRAGGPLKVSVAEYQAPVIPLLLKAAANLGFPVKDYNMPDGHGFAATQATIRNGVRDSVDVAYLRKASLRDNLHILTNARVTKLLIEDLITRGVTLVLNGVRHTVSVRKEVILSAGTIGSPHLLLLSGVGPAEHLREVGVSVKADLPVGNNLQDHIFLSLGFTTNERIGLDMSDFLSISSLARYFLFGSGPLTLPAYEALGFFNLENKTDANPDIGYFFRSTDFIGIPEHLAAQIFDGVGQNEETKLFYLQLNREKLKSKCRGCGWSTLAVLLNAKSRGTIRLASSDPFQPPNIDPKYLTDEYDGESLLKAHKELLKLASTDPMKSFGSRVSVDSAVPGCRDHEYGSDAYLRCWIRQAAWTDFHPVGTCKMGAIDDPDAVVDAQLRVKGVHGLRVVDCSVMPEITSSNTNAPAIMIGERAADLIRGIDSVGKIREDLKNKSLI